MLGANDVRFSRLMDRREAPGRKRMAIRSPDGAARHPIFSPPAPFLLSHLLFSPTAFVRSSSATSLAQTVFEILKGVPVHAHRSLTTPPGTWLPTGWWERR